MSAIPRVLILADDCNPQWPSLPVVGYKYARSILAATGGTLATHVRNRENIEAAGDMTGRVRYIDNEWIAAPMDRLSLWLRGGEQVAWSVQQAMAYLPYLEFERQALKSFRDELEMGYFDVVHRITPMTPTRPSFAAGRTGTPFVIGPLNGNLDWPSEFREEQTREKERLRILRRAYTYLPFSGSTFRRADAILAAFRHTIADLKAADPDRIVPMPEIGVDLEVFHSRNRTPAFSGPGPYRFLYAGRLVPYKLPEAVVRAFATSPRLAAHHLEIIGTGPEEARLRKIVSDTGAGSRVVFSGWKSQEEVASAMRGADAFVFPSIRELGAGVVIEAMASGAVCLVADYGAPGDLAANGRGVAVPLAPLKILTESLGSAMEAMLDRPQEHREMSVRAETYARSLYDWDAKARYTLDIYRAVVEGRPLSGFTAYL